MASQVEIVNYALTLLGQDRILSIDDDLKAAREAKAVYSIVRDALLAGYTWSFAKTRASIPASVTVPAFQFANTYPLPVDCLRIIMIGDIYVGADLTDYRNTPVEEYAIEGREILTDLPAPLKLRYIKQVTDTTQFSANFSESLGCSLAERLAEPVAQSETKRDRATVAFKDSISKAVRANAIELAPQKLADDEWILSRL